MAAFRSLCLALLIAIVAVVNADDIRGSSNGMVARRALLSKKHSPPHKPSKHSPPKAKHSPPKSPKAKRSPPKSPKAEHSPAPKSPSASHGMGASKHVKVGPDGLSVFAPKALAVKVGDKVTFTLKSMGHNVMFQTAPAGVDKAGLSKPSWLMDGIIGDSYTITIPKAGTYSYYCAPHAGVGMAGTITAS